ncbi:MAG: hypothetical protein HUU55_00650 [Myxococcales bacterium]|nr:hypothetical protein [Myxococcales bacterium]
MKKYGCDLWAWIWLRIGFGKPESYREYGVGIVAGEAAKIRLAKNSPKKHQPPRTDRHIELLIFVSEVVRYGFCRRKTSTGVLRYGFLSAQNVNRSTPVRVLPAQNVNRSTPVRVLLAKVHIMPK